MRKLLWPIFGLALCFTRGAFSQTTASEATPEPTVPDAALRALKDRRVVLTTAQEAIRGKILGFEAGTITIAKDSGEVVTVPRAGVVGVRLAEESQAPALGEQPHEEAIEEPPPSRPRYFAALITLAPGVGFDFDYSYFHAFISTSLLFPLVSSGSVFALTGGAGATFPLSEHWRFDFFAHVVPFFYKWATFGSQSTHTYIGVGAGIGFHYTASSGWTVGVKLPIVGASAGDYGSGDQTVGAATGYYYWSSAMSLPVLSFGYRF
jgi:hypothetical protein